MEEVKQTLDMGRYAAFVWPAFAVTAAVMIGFVVVTLRQLRVRRRMLETLEIGTLRRRRRMEEAR